VTKKPNLHLNFKSKKDINLIKDNNIKTSKISISMNTKKNIELLPGYKEGLWWVQDYAATIPVKLIKNLNNKKVLDMCSAPGGKTFQLLNAGAIVTSCESSKKRSEILEINAKRLNFKLNIIKKDVLKISTKDKYDVVLIDAPCSSSGTIKKNPEILFRLKKPNFDFFINTQYKMLEKATQLIKNGGVIIFSTCSLSNLEGKKQIEKFLLNHKEYYNDSIKKNEMEKFSNLITSDGYFQSYPCDLNEMFGIDGFFIARLKKNN